MYRSHQHKERQRRLKLNTKHHRNKITYITCSLVLGKHSVLDNTKICLRRQTRAPTCCMYLIIEKRKTNIFMTNFNFSKKHITTFQTAYLVIQHMFGMRRNFIVDVEIEYTILFIIIIQHKLRWLYFDTLYHKHFLGNAKQ